METLAPIETPRPSPVTSRLGRPGAWMRRHPGVVTLIGSLIVAAALVIGLWSKREDFVEAFTSASFLVLSAAVALQVIWLIARSEAWHVCVEAAGGKVSRRRLYRAAAVGYLGNLFNSNFGLGVRIAALRRSAPADSPNAPVLVAAELPIVVVEGALAAGLSFTLIGPLDVPWWVVLGIVLVATAVIGGLTRFVRDRREGFWKGLDVMRGLQSRNVVIGLVMFATGAQVVRNMVVLEGLGVDISVFDAVALLIAAAAVGLLPVGPTLGAATAVLILGSNGVAVVAAAGALLTATGAVGAFLFAGWALVDRLRPSAGRDLEPEPDPAPPGPGLAI
ncbi:MAG: flippase-like domain-containing protein [Actinomycetota bacterium]|nr:flippase-like domain-containing protein [Actinomycetota bacterium]